MSTPWPPALDSSSAVKPHGAAGVKVRTARVTGGRLRTHSCRRIPARPRGARTGRGRSAAPSADSPERGPAPLPGGARAQTPAPRCARRSHWSQDPEGNGVLRVARGLELRSQRHGPRPSRHRNHRYAIDAAGLRHEHECDGAFRLRARARCERLRRGRGRSLLVVELARHRPDALLAAAASSPAHPSCHGGGPRRWTSTTP